MVWSCLQGEAYFSIHLLLVVFDQQPGLSHSLNPGPEIPASAGQYPTAPPSQQAGAAETVLSDWSEHAAASRSAGRKYRAHHALKTEKLSGKQGVM